MTAPDKRRPLPALVVIAALTLLTALVWFRVLHRSETHPAATKTPCPTPSATAPSGLPKPSLVTLIVLNSTSRVGLAAGVRTALLKDGFKIPTKALDDSTTYGGHGELTGVGEIRFGPSARVAATLVSYYVPGATLVATTSPATSVIVSLGEKYVALATPARVAAAVASAHVGQAKTTASPSPTPTPSGSC
jgi:hypothetical protein